MSSSVFTCSICKKPTKMEESCPVSDVKEKVMGRTCQACRNTTLRLRCSATKCATPLYKLKYSKSLPKSEDGLSPEGKKTFLEKEFGSVALISSLRCCGACYVRLHRLSSSKNKIVSQPQSVNNSLQNQVGHPSVSYELPSKRTQGWPSGESTCLPPMWSGFDFRTRRHTWIEFVGSLLCYERFSPGYSGFPLSPKTNI